MAILLVATGSLGFGFGATVMAMNTYAGEFFPGREDRAMLVLNALLGAGTALAPLLVAIFVGLGAWWLLPVIVAVRWRASSFSATQAARSVAWRCGRSSKAYKRLPRRFWLFAAAVLLYGIVETLNGNWSGPYLTGERGVSAARSILRARSVLGDGHHRTNFVRRSCPRRRRTLDLAACPSC